MIMVNFSFYLMVKLLENDFVLSSLSLNKNKSSLTVLVIITSTTILYFQGEEREERTTNYFTKNVILEILLRNKQETTENRF